MKLNQATDYAFRMVLHMSLLPNGTKITGGELAKSAENSGSISSQNYEKFNIRQYYAIVPRCRWRFCLST